MQWECLSHSLHSLVSFVSFVDQFAASIFRFTGAFGTTVGG